MMSANFLDNNNENYDFKKRQKNRQRVFVVLSLFSAVVIFFGFWQIRNRIISPFVFDEKIIAERERLSEAENPFLNTENLDTDNDGLSDSDEYNIYGTSPFLEDTDSDGISDKDEIERGTNPKCPEGQNCFNENAFVAEDNSYSIPENQIDFNTSPELSEEELRQAIAGEVSADVLRSYLLENGIEKEVLDQISDEELLTSYQAELNKQNE